MNPEGVVISRRNALLGAGAFCLAAAAVGGIGFFDARDGDIALYRRRQRDLMVDKRTDPEGFNYAGMHTYGTPFLLFVFIAAVLTFVGLRKPQA